MTRNQSQFLSILGLVVVLMYCVGGVGVLTPLSQPSASVRPIPTLTPLPPANRANSLRVAAEVTRVIDGDTIVVSMAGVSYHVRYIGIDAPETVAPGLPVAWMGPEASAANKALVDHKAVYLEKDVSETDRYGRLLRYVYVGDLFVNAELVREGFAHVSTYPPDVKYQTFFLQEEQEARKARLGLWMTIRP